MTAPEKFAFTLAEVAELTGLTLRSLKEGCAARPPKVPHFRYGRQIRMTREHIAQLVAQHEVTAPSGQVTQIDDARVERARRRTARRMGWEAAS